MAPFSFGIERQNFTAAFGGRVISKRFARMTPAARQDLIWKYLDEASERNEATLISFIVTDTQQERDALERTG